EYARNDEDKLALAALRLRESKERKTAEKRERELQRTDKAPPSKRGRWVGPWHGLAAFLYVSLSQRPSTAATPHTKSICRSFPMCLLFGVHQYFQLSLAEGIPAEG
ncbi:hypothetical protein FRC01_011996, partial [Tulasnella sp. 417]